MSLKKALPFALIFALIGLAVLILSAGPAAGPQPLAPAVNRGAAVTGDSQGLVRPVVVNLKDIPAGVYDPNNQYDRWQRGEIELENGESIVDRAREEDLRVAALKLPVSENITLAGDASALDAPTAGTSFDSLDYTECCGGGGNVPPDPEIAVGPSHVIAVVNVAFEIYDKAGNSLNGPTTFSSFLASDPNCSGVFDPNVVYDESADRYALGIDANGTHYCLAVSQTGDPTGAWNIYSFPTTSGRDFFDYPHLGVGRDAFYMGANIFGVRLFKEGRVWAFDKAAMYAGAGAASATVGLGSAEDTPQPLNLHGWNQGTWPASGPHYFLTETNYNGANYTVFSWADPFGANQFSSVGTVDLTSATGVAAGMPVDTPQLNGQTIQANDFRPQDFEYRNGYAWTSNTISCNPGGGTVNCVRWAKIDPSTATVVDAGVFSSQGDYRTFADLAVDACDNMGIGYTKSSTSIHPAIWVTGRLATDAAGTLQAETQLKAGEIVYTSFESSAPRRWGDYTEMTIDPAGTTFWYLGEYSKNTGTSNGRWGTYIGSFTYGCGGGGQPPTATPAPSPTPGTEPSPTPTQPAQGNSMHISAIDMTVVQRGPNYDVRTTVTIVDQNGSGLGGATVDLTMTLPDGTLATGSGTTNGNGQVTFSLKSRQTGTYTSTVTNVTLSGYTYDSGANVETSASVSTP